MGGPLPVDSPASRRPWRPTANSAGWMAPATIARASGRRLGSRPLECFPQVVDVLVVEPQQSELAIAHDALRVDHEDRAADQAARAEDPVGANHGPVRIGKQRDSEAVPGAEALVGVERLR